MSTTNILDLNNRIDELANSYPASKVMLNSGDSVEEKIGNVRMAKLWENPNPSTSFAAQTVAVDLSGYDLILTLTNGGASAIATNIIGKAVYLNESVAAANTEVITRRRIGIINNNGIEFNDAYRAGHSASGSVDNTLLVPYRIYGIKLT